MTRSSRPDARRFLEGQPHHTMVPPSPGAFSSGRIIKLMIGQGYGFIRMADHRGVFFHRADLRDGIAFNDLVVGHAVTFELINDPISGARARGVHPNE